MLHICVTEQDTQPKSLNKKMSTVKSKQVSKQLNQQIKSRNYVSTYLGDIEAQQFEEVLCELQLSKAALGKALIRAALSKIKRPISSREALNLIRLGKLN